MRMLDLVSSETEYQKVLTTEAIKGIEQKQTAGYNP
jgi:hypothetical protein